MRLRFWTVWALVLVVISCGGSGGDGPSGKGLTFNTDAVYCTANRGSFAPATEYVDVTVTDPNAAYIIIGYPPDATVPYWLDLGLTGSGSNWTVSIDITSTLLTAGEHSAIVRVVIADSNENVLGYRDLTVYYTITDEFAVTPSQLNFQYTAGDASMPANQRVSLGGSGVSWTASADQSWVTLERNSGTTPFFLYVGVDPDGLASGTYNATVTITDGVQSFDIDVTFSVSNNLSASPSGLNFTFDSNGSLPFDQAVSIGGNNLSWTASADQAWVTLDAASGTAPSTMRVGVNPSGLASGTHTATVTLTDGNTSAAIGVTLNVSNGLSASATSLNFSYDNTGTLPSSQTITIGGYGIPWTASANQGWVTLSTTSGTAPSALSVGVDPSGLVSGTYTATITVTDGTTAVDIDLTFTVSNDLGTQPQNISFSHISGDSATPPNQAVSIRGYGRTWSAAANQAWVTLSSTGGTGPSTIDVGVDPSGMAAGTYAASVTISDGGGNTVLGITLNVAAPSFSVTPGSVLLGGSDGMSFDAQALEFTLATGSNTYPWTVTLQTDSGDTWLLSDTTSGAVSATAATINIDSDPSATGAGTHTGSIVLNATVNGDLITSNVPVTFNLENHALFVADNGIALTSTPTVNKLAHTVTVTDTYGLTTTPWSAVSNQPWLTLSAVSGMTGEEITVTANPFSLITDTVHYATVTITSTDATIQNSETIQVGFWVGSSPPIIEIVDDAPYTELAVDPIRPNVYVHTGGTEIVVHNVHTGAPPPVITVVAQQLGPMVTSSDGKYLFVSDLTTGQILPVDLETHLVGTAWDLAATPANMRLAYARPKGHAVVLASDGYAYDAGDGTRLVDAFYANANLVTSMDSTALFIQNLGLSPATLYRYDMDYSALNQRGVIIENEINDYDAGPGADLAISPDGTRLYTACGAPYEFTYYNPDTLERVGALPAIAYPNNVHVGVNGNLYGGNTRLNPDLWVYDSGDNLLLSTTTLNSGIGPQNRQLAVSEDGLRVLMITSFPNLQIFDGP